MHICFLIIAEFIYCTKLMILRIYTNEGNSLYIENFITHVLSIKMNHIKYMIY